MKKHIVTDLKQFPARYSLEKETKRRFGAAVKSLRHKRGMTQEQLAAVSGMHRTYIADVERGTRNVSIGTAARFMSALNITAQNFYRLIERIG